MAWTIEALSTGLAATTFLIGFSSLRLRAERDRALSRSDSVATDLTRAGATERMVTDGEVDAAAEALVQADRRDPVGRWTLIFTATTFVLMVGLGAMSGIRSGQAFQINPLQWSNETYSVTFFLILEIGIVALGFADYRWVGLDLDHRLKSSVVAVAARAIELYKSDNRQEALAITDDVVERAPSWPWVHAFRARIFSDLEDHEKAVLAISRAVRLEPSNPWWRLVRAELYLAEKRFDNALAELNGIDGDAIDASATSTLRGAALYGLGQRDEALFVFNQAVEYNPEDPDRRMKRGQALLNDAEKKHGGSPSALFIDMLLDDGERVAMRTVSAVGQDRLRARDAAAALADFDFVLSQDDSNSNALIWRGMAKYELGDFSSGDADFARAIELGVSQRRVHVVRGRVLARLGLSTRAESEYTLALNIKATASALKARAFLRGSLGREEEALSDFRKAAELDPDDLDAAAHLAERLADAGELEDSDTIFDQIRDRGPNLAHTYWVWITTLLRTGREAEAETVLIKALDATFNDEDRTRMLALAGSVYTELRLFRKALDSFDEADRISPRSPEVSYRRGLCFARRGEVQEAIDALNEAAEHDWYLQFAALATRSSLLRETGAFAKALPDISNAIRLQPENDRIRVSRGCLAMAMGDFDSAIADLNIALELRPNGTPALIHRVQARQKIGDSEGADADLAVLANLLPSGHPLILDARASRHFAAREWTEAANLYRQMLSTGDDPLILFLLGASYVNNSQFDDAEEVFRLLARKDPSVQNRAAAALAISLQGRSEEAISAFSALRQSDAEEEVNWMSALDPDVLPNFDVAMRDWEASELRE
ncbi:tetratricopeptide repeat protein [Curtobacterium flaccumfaciens]|uniref:tetratricopeptide repeat protein n=1 Tax=Curtobacterium flaccumfaciens TaxID=2035 RepID=UPI001BDEBF10|nr:tetratricopeptide repeat protein [Curtobacterium flaccumfaciens]MBT1632970.1 tetratricopeptide repeat protein [Curtobacterium flaccumfaciens pv. oortii]MCX2844910.1 tetratricopeptide repeat protein [Curtobacterium flaccumfaciens pv. oortii]